MLQKNSVEHFRPLISTLRHHNLETLTEGNRLIFEPEWLWDVFSPKRTYRGHRNNIFENFFEKNFFGHFGKDPLRISLLKLAHKWKKSNFRKFQLHRYKKDIHMELRGFRRGLVHPHTASFQCQTRCAASGQKTQNHFLACMRLYKGFLTKISPQMKKSEFSKISTSSLQKRYPYGATRFSERLGTPPDCFFSIPDPMRHVWSKNSESLFGLYEAL